MRFLWIGIFWGISVFAAPILLKGPSSQQLEQIERQNARERARFYQTRQGSSEILRPYAEFEPAEFLLMSGEFLWNSKAVKTQIAANLPQGVQLVVLAVNPEQKADLEDYFLDFIDASQLQVKDIQVDSGFWARDSLPIPVYVGDESSKKLGLVDAAYFHGNEPDLEISKLFQVKLFSHSFFYEGGNFAADAKGTCFTEEGRDLDDAVMKKYYGCKKTIHLPKMGGVGHLDERVKIVSNTDVLTNESSYKTILEKEGYNVHILPALAGYSSYANSLLVNGTAFVPIFGVNEDSLALKAYEELGFKAIGINASDLVTGQGAIHCITMTYPHAILR